MAKVKESPAFLALLKKALVAELKAKGIQAKVHSEPVPSTRLHRVTVVAPQFKALKHSERQSIVWRIAEKALSPDDQLGISMILTLTRDEAAGR